MTGDNTHCDALFVGPHPDDVELFCGGTVARLVSLGYRVVIVDLTRGEMASNGDPESRAAEAQAAATILGVALRENLGLPDACLEPTQHAPALAQAIRAHRPELIFAPSAFDRHPDHEAAHALVRRAVFLAGLAKFAPDGGASFRPTSTLFYPMHTHARADLCVSIDATFELKQRAIDCFSSQLSPPTAGPATTLNRAAYRSELVARDRFYGAQIGSVAAEPFISEGPIAVDDPVALFKGQALSPWRMRGRL